MLYAILINEQNKLAELRETNLNLQNELDEVKRELEELKKKKTPYPPCFGYPGSETPSKLGLVIIETTSSFRIIDDTTGQTYFIDKVFTFSAKTEFGSLINILFIKERNFAKKNGCYILIDLQNKTNDYSIYLSYKNMLKKAGIDASDKQ